MRSSWRAESALLTRPNGAVVWRAIDAGEAQFLAACASGRACDDVLESVLDAGSGFDLAKNIGWLWSCLAAWCVLVPTTMSRRSIMQMRGARVAAAVLSAFPGISAAIVWQCSA